jgi:hypothetical protein
MEGEIMHLQWWEWYSIGKYGGIAVLAGAGWLSRQKWMPHRHDGYVGWSGKITGCSVCGRKPETTLCQHCEHPYLTGGRCPRWCPPAGYVRCFQCGATVPEDEMTDGHCAECNKQFGPMMSELKGK